MSAPDPLVDAQLQHLLDVVQRDRDRRCQELIEEANSQARQIVRQAYREARAHAHDDLAALREQLRQRVNSAAAQRQTRLRQLQQQADRAYLEAAWQPLQAALRRRWEETESRTQWVEQLVETAALTLLDRNWRIEHAPDWPQDEREALRSRLESEPGCSAAFAPQPGISAGLRIMAQGACVDGTVDGLLRRRSYIEALLLAGISNQHGTPGSLSAPVNARDPE